MDKIKIKDYTVVVLPIKWNKCRRNYEENKNDMGSGFVLWTAFIFTRSMQPAGMSNEESGRLLSLLEQLLPFELSNHFVRKAAHFVEYAVLGFLGWFVFARRNVAFERLVFAVVTCLLVALCDETIQLFVEGRAGKVPDIWLDMAGVLAGVLVGGVFQTLCRRVKKK